MDGMLSQDEINALLNGMSLNSEPEAIDEPVEMEMEERLTDAEIDALGEIANISMGTAATTLSSLLGQKVTITTPHVSYATWNDVSNSYQKPCVLMKISYVDGLAGDNVLILKEDDVKIITSLMMGGSGEITDEPLTELHLSAIGEAMNQMMGSASTSMSSMLNKKIDISPPVADLVDFNQDEDFKGLLDKTFVKISFEMQVENLIDSNIMQLYPIDFAKSLYQQFMNGMEPAPASQPAPKPEPQPVQQPAPQPVQQPVQQPMMQPMQQPMMQPMMPPMGYGMPMQNFAQPVQQVDVSPATFQPFAGDYMGAGGQRENIDLIMDVPLEVTVELGRTNKSIKEILEFAPGAILELNKIAGEPVDVLVNNKLVAKGEVVVIEESFGVRISEIIK